MSINLMRYICWLNHRSTCSQKTTPHCTSKAQCGEMFFSKGQKKHVYSMYTEAYHPFKVYSDQLYHSNQNQIQY